SLPAPGAMWTSPVPSTSLRSVQGTTLCFPTVPDFSTASNSSKGPLYSRPRRSFPDNSCRVSAVPKNLGRVALARYRISPWLRTLTYVIVGLAATATLDVRVHGVVVQTRRASAGLFLRWNFTVSAEWTISL